MAVAGATQAQKDAMEAALTTLRSDLRLQTPRLSLAARRTGGGRISQERPTMDHQRGRTMRPLFVGGIRHRPPPTLQSGNKHLHALLRPAQRFSPIRGKAQKAPVSPGRMCYSDLPITGPDTLI